MTSVDSTPAVQAAYGELIKHAAACWACKLIRDKGIKLGNGMCINGDRLIEAHRAARRAARKEGT
ncbi:hypothetical protein [Streptomyces adelaidensis]|jgi:hypothetical protein|uniref:hypothetical protein n=1 Tax=Streptomyces adelaidensis TaxID=2796465 RepID=UPI0019042B53|nr:hypothetical protein [Streptomyces adelaidensis]